MVMMVTVMMMVCRGEAFLSGLDRYAYSTFSKRIPTSQHDVQEQCSCEWVIVQSTATRRLQNMQVQLHAGVGPASTPRGKPRLPPRMLHRLAQVTGPRKNGMLFSGVEAKNTLRAEA